MGPRLRSERRWGRQSPSFFSVLPVLSFLFSQKAERTLNSFTQQIIEEFRANGGRVGGPFDGARLLLLTTTGARSGKPHTAVLGYYPDTSDRLLIVGSAGGGPKQPDWYYNLLANPRVTVEDGLHTYEADAVVLRDAERDEIFDRLVEAEPGWGKYQANTTRILPVVALTAATTGPPPATLTLRMIHDAFRHELALVRKEVATAATTGSMAGFGAQLRINCLKLCQGLHFHHTRESEGLFPALLATNPDLADTIDRLDQEHAQIATLLEELQTLLTSTPAADVLPRLDTLIEALNHHLTYEENQLLPLLGG